MRFRYKTASMEVAIWLRTTERARSQAGSQSQVGSVFADSFCLLDERDVLIRIVLLYVFHKCLHSGAFVGFLVHRHVETPLRMFPGKHEHKNTSVFLKFFYGKPAYQRYTYTRGHQVLNCLLVLAITFRRSSSKPSAPIIASAAFWVPLPFSRNITGCLKASA